MIVENTSAPTNDIIVWHSIKWGKNYKIVKRLQARIVKAVQANRWNKVKALQRLLTCSLSGKVIAIRRVTENRGKRTPGVDMETWKTPVAKAEAIKLLKRRGYKPQPLRRIYIPKSDGRKRPLSIPTMKDRAMQALYKLVLEPIAEATADRHSYGFRPERSTADAIEQCYTVLSRKKAGAKWVLEADIEGCFDNISHEWLQSNIPMDKTIINKWLKAGYMDNNLLYATEQGTPQGGIISPILANMALDGLGKRLAEEFPMKISSRKPAHKVNYIRYCDDFIITGRTKELINDKVLPIVKGFLAERGLRLSEKKTKITYINQGFDFLGQNIRKYKDNRLIIKPSKDSCKKLLKKIRDKLRRYKMNTHEEVICVLNPIIKGWVNYHRHVSSASTFSKLRHYIWKSLWLWCRKRHKSQKNAQWIKDKYFTRIHGQDWCFTYRKKTKEGIVMSTIANPTKTRIVRHVKVKADLNPYDDKWQQYLEQRTKLKMLQSLSSDKKLFNLWKSQQGMCPICRQGITTDIGWEVHHIKEKSKGGEDIPSNLVMLHPICHKQVHSQKINVTKPGPKKGLIQRLEPDEGKLSSPVLRGGRCRVNPPFLLDFRNLIIIAMVICIAAFSVAQAEDHEFARKLLTINNKLLEKKEQETIKEIDRQGLEHIQNALSTKQIKKEERYVFVSLSMPEQGLLEIIRQAKKYDFVPIMRGFKEDSYKKTVIALEEIIKKTEHGVVIDPELFKEFEIKSVPAFVITKPKVPCTNNMSCGLRGHNKLSGNVTVGFALNELLEKGEEL